MGGAIGKDHGALEYTERNIYLNSQETYGRMKPDRPITIHQKALFCLWMIIICLYIMVKISKFWKWILSKLKQKDSSELEEDHVESQKPVEKETKQESSIANGGTKALEEESSEKKTTLSLWARISETCPEQPTYEKFLTQAVLFGCIMLYFWLCDFQHIWYKTDKQYSRDMFIFIFFLLVFVAFVLTIKPTSDKILNRDQTEEWKGWMQVQFVWYHYYNAQEVFNSIRCYIGAYVWMTGYGNFCCHEPATNLYTLTRNMRILLKKTAVRLREDRTGHAQLMVEADNECGLPCSKKLWDGYGRWDLKNQWKPFMDEINLPSSLGKWHNFEGRKNLDYIGKHKKGEGTFWIYGDSLSFYFYESFSKTQQHFCETHFKMCNVSYNWIYPKTLYELTETCSETELKVPKVVYYLREVTNKPNMVDENSVLLFNAGAHYVKTRVKLFNAYSNEVMCKAGVTFLDIYPISASYPDGTKDGIHYESKVFYPVEELLVSYFSRE
ncbi:REDUCED WALL ACETYLATION 1-like [Paramuricea clavata]|uniref:REDUCED WALL ACETYLATION 1-like n=1 Tax=Paramuricea clavata TaxID=317549 RepID=A0A6S7FPK5_PARCT|nr:REDUCED WALL ACETYLATION 1-like [Paramuricea clavata]